MYSPAQDGVLNRAFRFKVTLDELEVADFCYASGLIVQIEVLEHPEGGINDHMHKLVGPARWTPIVLARGSSASKDLFDWLRANRDGNVQRKSGSIIALDQQGNAIVRWDFREAWPSRYEGPEFEYGGSEISIERIELSHRGFDMKIEGE